MQGFDASEWETMVCLIADELTWQKFSHPANAEYAKMLLLTGDDLLAEASPTDTIWGIGLPDSDQRVSDPSECRGTNVLGWALMQTRERLHFLEEHQPRAASLPSTDTLAETNRQPVHRRLRSGSPGRLALEGRAG